MSQLQMSSVVGNTDIAVFAHDYPKCQCTTSLHGVSAVKCGRMLGSNCKIWDLSLTSEVWDSSVGFIRPWDL